MTFMDLLERVGASKRVFELELDGTKADLEREMRFAEFFGEFTRAQGAFDNPVYRKRFGDVYSDVDRIMAKLTRPISVEIGLGPRGYAISCMPALLANGGVQKNLRDIEKFFGASFDYDCRTGGFMGAKRVSLELPSAVVPVSEAVVVR